MTILQKNELVAYDDSYFKATVLSNGKLKCTVGSDTSGDKVEIEGQVVDENSWEYWAISVQMDPDATHSDIRVMLGV